MGKKKHIIFTLILFSYRIVFSQTPSQDSSKNATPFNYSYWNGVADKQQLSQSERQELLSEQKRIYYEGHSHTHINNDSILWVTDPTPLSSKGSSQNSIFAGPCTNIDFESGTMAGWVRSRGFNPLTNTIGCCPNPNGDQTIMTGAGTDPYGNFPVVFPGGGNFSLRLGSVATGGIADRISQTFFVTPSNANFTYRYAIVLNDGGHAIASQPRFTSEIIDSLGNAVPCTFYQVAAGTNSAGIIASTLTPANGSPVSYKNWTSVIVDLTPNIGQNVTLRFTVYDCGPSAHFAYAYIDGVCTSFATSVADTTCPNVPVTMCAPVGFSTTTWNGPGIVNTQSLCINAVLPGTYTCSTVLIPGCPGPTFTHTLNLLAKPLVSFTPVTSGVCSTQYTFNSSISVATGSVISYQWFFGDGTTASNVLNPAHNFSTAGTYQVKLKAFTNRGCSDSIVVPVTAYPYPNLAFSPPSNCINTAIQFTNNSTIPVGTISGYTWTLGNGPTSNLVNPVNTYTTNGTYTINLIATSNVGCVSSLTQTLGIFPTPLISFSASPLCDINGTYFSPSTSTAIASGSLTTFFWNFGDGGTSNQSNPTHIYASPGTYTVNFTAISNNNCPATITNTFLISPSPSVAFSTTSINACSPNFTFTNNSGISSGPISYTWNFGSGNINTTTATSLSYAFPSIGEYTVSLVGISNMGCTDTAYKYISVYPYPVVSVNTPASCENAIFTVSTTAVSGSVTSYLWNFGDPASGAANTSTLQSPNHSYAVTNNYTITLNLLSNLNCPSSILTPITVFPNPKALFTYTTLNNCSLPYTYLNSSTVSSIGASSIISYYWNVGGVGTSTLANLGTANFPTNGTYSVSLVVNTNHNCSDTLSRTILVHPFPTLDFDALSSCLNKPVNFSATSSISPVPSATSSINSYTWSFGDNSYSNSPVPPPHAYLTSGIYTVSFGATSNKNCVSSVTQTLEVYPMAISDFTASNLCFGDATQFTSTNSISSGTIYAYNWDFGDGIIGSNTTISHTYSTSASFPVNFSVTTNNECLTRITKTITVYPLPVSSFTANGGCLNILSQFSQTSTIPVGSITSYSWNFGDGNSSANQFANYTYTTFGNYTPTLTVGSNRGCYTSVTNTLVIHPLPAIAFSPPSSCQGSAIQFTNTSSIPLGSIVSYTWNFADGSPNSTLNSPLHSYTQAIVYNVVLASTSNMGCIKTTTNSLSIYPLPQATVTPIFNSCINDAALINTNMSITSGSIASYVLNYGDGGFSSFSSPITSSNTTHTHTYNAYNAYTLTLNVSSNNNCSITVSDSIRIYPKPFVNFTPNSVCFGESITFNNLSNIPSSGTYSIDEHLWQFNDGSATPTSTLFGPTHTFPGTNTYTTYNVMLTEFSHPEAQNLNSNLTCSASATKIVTVFPLPVVSFTNSTACFGKSTFFGNTTNTLNIVGWSWYFYNTNQFYSVAQNPSFTYSNSGTYTAQLVALNSFGCRDTFSKSVEVYANPSPSFTANQVCFKNQTTFTNSSTYGSGTSAQYTWNVVGGNDFSFDATPTTYSFNSPGTHTVMLTASSDLGCTSIFTSSVLVYYLPNVNFNANDACHGKPTLFSNVSSNAVSFDWNFGEPSSGNNNTSNMINPTHLYSSYGGFSSTLVATSSNNCKADTVMNVAVRRSPVADFTSKVICVDYDAAFTNLSSSPDGTIALHQWDFDGDGVIDQTVQTPTFAYTSSGDQKVRLIVTTQFGCIDDSSKIIYAHPKPVAKFESDKKNGCPTLCVNFKNLSSISTGSFTSEWDFGDGSSASTAQNPSHCYQAGNYDLTLSLTSDVGCKSKLNYVGAVIVAPNPIAGFITTPDEIDEEEPVVNIQSNASSDVVFTKYYVSDGTNFYKANVTHYLKNLDGKTKPMVVQIVSNKYGCVDTLYKVLDVKPAYSLYIPNTFTPNGDGRNDEFQAKGVGILKFSMQIYDRWGHSVFETKDIYSTWDGKVKGGDELIKEDVYIWKAQVIDILNQSHDLIGHVNLVR